MALLPKANMISSSVGNTMESAIVLSADDVKSILAEHFEVDEKDVFRSQYSYVVKNVKCDKLISKDL